MVKRFEVYLVSLDPTLGSEIKKTRPCVVVSPNEMQGLNTSIIAPMTTKSKPYPTRIPVKFADKDGFIVLDQIRTVDKTRLLQFLGIIDKKTGLEMLSVLREMFDQ
jgi:mRNA interferase MazF